MKIIKQALTTVSTVNTKSQNQSVVTADRGSGRIQTSEAKLTIPPEIASKLSHFSKQYNLPFDLSELTLESITPEKVQTLRSIVDMMVANSKLLPEIIKQTKRLMRADVSLAQAHGELAKAALKHQEKLDRNVADIFFACAQHKAKSEKLAASTNRRIQLLEQRTALQIDRANKSVFGDEMRLMDAEYKIAVDNKKRLTDAKINRKQADNYQRQQLENYVNSAFV